MPALQGSSQRKNGVSAYKYPMREVGFGDRGVTYLGSPPRCDFRVWLLVSSEVQPFVNLTAQTEPCIT